MDDLLARARKLRQTKGGGWSYDPKWKTRRIIRMNPRTLKRLRVISDYVKAETGHRISPMGIAALLLEGATLKAARELEA